MVSMVSTAIWLVEVVASNAIASRHHLLLKNPVPRCLELLQCKELHPDLIRSRNGEICPGNKVLAKVFQGPLLGGHNNFRNPCASPFSITVV
jgi:hypothetical protein